MIHCDMIPAVRALSALIDFSIFSGIVKNPDFFHILSRSWKGQIQAAFKSHFTLWCGQRNVIKAKQAAVFLQQVLIILGGGVNRRYGQRGRRVNMLSGQADSSDRIFQCTRAVSVLIYIRQTKINRVSPAPEIIAFRTPAVQLILKPILLHFVY